MSTATGQRACERAATLALVVAVGSAVSGLPAALLPWPWLLALTGPAALLGLLRRPPRWPLARAAIATLLQLSACLLAWSHAGPIEHPAALAGTILPPLAFVTVRRKEADATLGLFLSFCVLLVGTILGGDSLPRFVTYVAAAALQLRCEARLLALRRANPWPAGPAAARAPWLSGLLFGALCALVATAVDRTLPLLPTPARSGDAGPAPQPDQRRSIGLPDSFELDGGGALLDLQGERLLDVGALDDGDVPPDLYLRSGYFEVPGLDSWRVGNLSREARDTSDAPWHLRRPHARAPVRRLEFLRAAAARNFVFVPPGLCSIAGVPDLFGDPQREWFRQPPGADGDVYEVTFQQQRAADGPPVESRWQRLGLAALPPELDQRWFAPLLAAWQPRGDALQKAARIAAGLQQRCRYERREPTGPYPHQLVNFLHGERIGFCMHFASAAAILLRMADVPCRIGVGLYGGSPGRDGSMRVYGSQHAHAWVEIPIRGLGFVVFDPTPPAERGVRAPAAAAPAYEPASAAAPDDAAGGLLAAVLDFLRRAAGTAWPWLLVLLALLLWSGHGRSERAPAAPAFARAVRPARRWLLQILRELARRGHPRPAATTLEQLGARLLQAGACPPDLRVAFSTYQEVRFGNRPWDEERQACMRRGLDAARLLPPAGNVTGS